MKTAAGLPGRHDRRSADGFVLWIVAFATIMVCLFAFRDGLDLVPNLAPAAFDAF